MNNMNFINQNFINFFTYMNRIKPITPINNYNNMNIYKNNDEHIYIGLQNIGDTLLHEYISLSIIVCLIYFFIKL